MSPLRDQSADTSAPDEIGWFDDDKCTLEKRVKQLMTGIHWAEEPLSRVAHIISNIRLVEKRETLDDGEELQVSSRFIVYRNRLETETDLLVGRREDLRKAGERRAQNRAPHFYNRAERAYGKEPDGLSLTLALALRAVAS